MAKGWLKVRLGLGWVKLGQVSVRSGQRRSGRAKVRLG